MVSTMPCCTQDAPLLVRQLLKSPDGDIKVVHVAAAPALVGVSIGGVCAWARVCDAHNHRLHAYSQHTAAWRGSEQERVMPQLMLQVGVAA